VCLREAQRERVVAKLRRPCVVVARWVLSCLRIGRNVIRCRC
jgi:hypothetical protein